MWKLFFSKSSYFYILVNIFSKNLLPFSHSEYFEHSKDTYHDKSIFISVMVVHEWSNFSSKIDHQNQKHEYGYHENSSMRLCPFSKSWVIWCEIFCLQKCKSSYQGDKKEREDAWLWNSEYERLCNFRKSFFKHLKCGKEDDKKSYPLDRWVFFELSCDPTRSYYHEDDRYHESYHEIDYITMTCSGNREDVIEWHRDIRDDDGLDSSFKGGSRLSSSMFGMFTRAYLTIKFPYHIEKEDGTEKFETRNFQEKDNAKGKNDTKDSGSCDSPKNRFFSHCWRQIFCCHAYEDSIISAHDEIYEDDIEEGKCSGRCEKMSKIDSKSIKHRKK